MGQTTSQIHLKPSKEVKSVLKRSGESAPVAPNETFPLGARRGISTKAGTKLTDGMHEC